MKNIHTLIPDIYELVQRKDGWFTDELAQELSTRIATRLQDQLGVDESARRRTLRLSQMGPRCPCALWHSIHKPDEAESLPPWAEIKYSYGHIIEALVITLAKAAGHHVCGEQDELNVDGILGHRDCVIDGCCVDVKSSSTRSFAKFKDGSIAQSDSFGYLEQLDGYVVGSLNDPMVTVKDRAYLLAIDKQLGHMVLYEHFIREQHIRDQIRKAKAVIGRDHPPACTCGTQPDGVSGNIKLDMRASYEPFKFACHPNLRTFLYSKGPVHLTKVVRLPDVPEVDRYGNQVH